MKKGKIGVTSENIFPIIKKFLYSDHEIFLRELVSNAVDATTKLKTLAARGEAVIAADTEFKVIVTLDEEAKRLTISDNGIGMSAEEIEKYINQIAFSGAEEFLAKYKDTNGIIGHFGLGFYSSFLVASKVEIVTKSYRQDAVAVRWECDGSPKYTLEDSTREAGHGTDIILHIDQESVEFADKTVSRGCSPNIVAFCPYQSSSTAAKSTTPLPCGHKNRAKSPTNSTTSSTTSSTRWPTNRCSTFT